MAKTVIVVQSAEAIRAQAALENQREVYKLARELDKSSFTRRMRESQERWRPSHDGWSDGTPLTSTDYELGL